jgi:hypothetical protein
MSSPEPFLETVCSLVNRIAVIAEPDKPDDAWSSASSDLLLDEAIQLLSTFREKPTLIETVEKTVFQRLLHATINAIHQARNS